MWQVLVDLLSLIFARYYPNVAMINESQTCACPCDHVIVIKPSMLNRIFFIDFNRIDIYFIRARIDLFIVIINHSY